MISGLMVVLIAGRLILGIDHVPVAVKDLELAESKLEQLGFTLKPGRNHGNSIKNAHAKFEDGTEIELITASSRDDAVSGAYVDFLEEREGPAFLCLYVEKSLTEFQSGVLGLRIRNWVVESPEGLNNVFFGRRNRLVSDGEWVTRHKNGAKRLGWVWMGEIGEVERRFWRRQGVRVEGGDSWFGDAERYRVGDGGVGFMESESDERILGVSVIVEDIELARKIVLASEFDYSHSLDSVMIYDVIGTGFIEFKEDMRF